MLWFDFDLLRQIYGDRTSRNIRTGDQQDHATAPPQTSAPESFGVTQPSDTPALASFPQELRNEIERLERSADAREQAWAHAVDIGWNDFPAALEVLKGVFNASDVRPKLIELVETLALYDLTLDGSYQRLSSVRSPGLRADASGAVIHAWARKDPRALARYANAHLNDPDRTSAIVSAARVLTESMAFQDAQEIVAAMSPSEDRANALSLLAERRAEQDRRAVIAWAKGLVQADETNALTSVACEAALSLDPKGMIGLASDLPDEHAKIVCFRVAAMKLVISDPDTTVKWIAQLPQDIQEALNASVAPVLAKSDLNQATALALGIHDGDLRATTVESVGSQLMSVAAPNIPATLNWIKGLPVDIQEKETIQLVMCWMKVDSLAARDWIGTLPDGDVRNQALGIFSAYSDWLLGKRAAKESTAKE